MLSREAFDRYSRQVSNLAGGAGEYVRRMVSAYLSQNPDASVAECRDFAWQVMLEAVQIYGDASATAAADYYDSVMSAAGNGAKPALLHSGVDEDQAERVARYQAGKLVKGDQLGFARECAAYASDATRQAANRTMLGNALRDEGRGVRYARVPTGAETCTFCRMLSSRGFVYRSKESAKLFGHNHRGCNCEVVVSTNADGLEGYDPDRERDIWQKYEEIDADESLSRAENEAAKRAVLGLNAPKDSDADVSLFKRLGVTEAEVDAPLPAGSASASSTTGKFKSYSLPSGRRFLFKANMDPSMQDMTPERLLSLYEKVPGHIKARMQKEIYVVDYANPSDAHWRKRYRNFSRSYARGGDEITLWAYTGHDDAYLVRTLCHETGHLVDAEEAPPGKNFSSGKTWDDAITLDYRHSKKTHPTKYAANSPAEDFAESVALYTVDSVNFRRDFPNRATILDRFFGGGDGANSSTSQ